MNLIENFITKGLQNYKLRQSRPDTDFERKYGRKKRVFHNSPEDVEDLYDLLDRYEARIVACEQAIAGLVK